MKKTILFFLFLIAGIIAVSAQQRVVLVEEGTGTWCQYCPRGDVYAQKLQKDFPGKFAFVSIHFNDPMQYQEYADAMPFTGLPSGWINRNSITQLLPFETLEQDMQTQLAVQPPASVDVSTEWNDTTRLLTMHVSASFTQNLTGDYRLAAIVIENGVTGTSPGYNQTNAYSGGAFGMMGGYENLPNPIPASIVAYNHVARHLAGGINGDVGSLPVSIVAGETHSHTYNYTLPDLYNKDYVRVIGVLVNATTGEILNAGVSNYVPGYANAGPYFQSKPLLKGFVNAQYKYSIVAHDPDYDSIVISSVSALPPGLSFTSTGDGNAEITGTPTAVGVYTITIKVTDGNHSSDQSFDLEIASSEGDWIQVGQQGINGFKPSAVDLEISKNGTPFMMFSNAKNSAIAVYEFQNDTWQKLGNDLTGDAFHASMTLDGEAPVVFSNGIASKWDGSKWNQLGSKLPGDFFIFSDIIRAGDSTLFAVYFAPSDNQTHTYRYDGSSWTFSGDVTDKYTVWNRFKLDQSGNPMLIYGIDGVNISYSQVSSWDGVKWNVLGNGHIDTVRTFYDHDITMDKNGNIYAVLTYGSVLQTLNVYKLNSVDDTWELAKSNLAGGAVKRCKIESDHLGNVFVAYRDESNAGKTSVQKFDGQNWLYVGSQAFTEIAGEQSLALNPDGVPYVAYADASLNDQVNVKKFKKSTTAVHSEPIADYDLVLYPNPTSGNLIIRTKSADSYQVLNAFGQILTRGKLSSSTDQSHSTTQIDLSGLNDGMYFICIKGNAGIQTSKLMLVR